MKWSPLGFNKQESTFVALVLLLLVGAIVVNLQVSYRKSRDLRRKDDVRAVTDALITFQEDNAYFPFSTDDGRIIACVENPDNPTLDDEGKIVYSPCTWGNDTIPKYLTMVPTDPNAATGTQYVYISNGSRFQMYAALESSSEPEYEEAIVQRGLLCGDTICNYGRAYASTPLDISLEEYENEIREKQ